MSDSRCGVFSHGESRCLTDIDVAYAGEAQLLQAGTRTDEILYEFVGGMSQNLFRCAVLFDFAAFVEDDNPVAEFHGFVEVMGHEHNCFV